MFRTGLVSISFRKHTAEEIIEEVRACGLQEIEWGSDVHVPAGDEQKALAVKALMEKNGLRTAAYGSYYELGVSEDPRRDFAPYLQTAALLGAPVIRIWGGKRGSAELSEKDFSALAAEARLIAEMAEEQGITLSLECHNNTVTDNYHSALRFIQQVNRKGLTMYWQPNQNYSFEYNLQAAEALAPFTTNIHAFSWDVINGELQRYPLQYHEDRWRNYLEIFRRQGGDHAILLEFMHDDKLKTLHETAATLSEWVK